MKTRTIFSSFLALMLFVTVSSFTTETPAKKFTPVGTWEYSVVGVPPEYETGKMIVTEEESSMKVTMSLNEYVKAEGEKVIYKNKSLSFIVWVESEEITISGTFDGDQFTGTVSYSEGDFDFTASRVAED